MCAGSISASSALGVTICVALGVSPDWYRGFIEAFLDVVEPAAVRDDHDRAVWQSLREGLVGLVERNRLV